SLSMSIGAGAGQLGKATVEYQGYFGDDIEQVLDFDTYVDTGSSGEVAYTFGLGQVFADDSSLVGGVFEKKVGDATWFAVCGDGSSLSPRVNTGVPISSAGAQMRVVWQGSAVADD